MLFTRGTVRRGAGNNRTPFSSVGPDGTLAGHRRERIPEHRSPTSNLSISTNELLRSPIVRPRLDDWPFTDESGHEEHDRFCAIVARSLRRRRPTVSNRARRGGGAIDAIPIRK